MSVCSMCQALAVVSYRVLPRRNVEPLSDAIKRALSWPGSEMPVDVSVCAKHIGDVKRAGSLLAVTALSQDVRTITVKDDDG